LRTTLLRAFFRGKAGRRFARGPIGSYGMERGPPAGTTGRGREERACRGGAPDTGLAAAGEVAKSVRRRPDQHGVARTAPPPLVRAAFFLRGKTSVVWRAPIHGSSARPRPGTGVPLGRHGSILEVYPQRTAGGRAAAARRWCQKGETNVMARSAATKQSQPREGETASLCSQRQGAGLSRDSPGGQDIGPGGRDGEQAGAKGLPWPRVDAFISSRLGTVRRVRAHAEARGSPLAPRARTRVLWLHGPAPAGEGPPDARPEAYARRHPPAPNGSWP
jgi:hypothetical protein